jgi:hypothetical protein
LKRKDNKKSILSLKITLENIKCNHAVPKDLMLQANTVSDVQNLLIGILSLSNVSLATPMNPGTQILICVNAVHLRELSNPENVPVQRQKLNGMPILKHATAHPTLLVIIASPVLLQGFGIKAKINVSVQAQKINGIHHHKSVNAQQENTENTVSNAQIQDIGT